MNMEDMSLKPCYNANLTISASQYGGFSTSDLVWCPALMWECEIVYMGKTFGECNGKLLSVSKICPYFLLQ